MPSWRIDFNKQWLPGIVARCRARSPCEEGSQRARAGRRRRRTHADRARDEAAHDVLAREFLAREAVEASIKPWLEKTALEAKGWRPQGIGIESKFLLKFTGGPGPEWILRP